MKKAIITGVTGQDGSYLSELLLEKGYEVHGIVRRSSTEFRERIAHLEGKNNFCLHYGDMSDSISLIKIISTVKPDEIYNLAAQSHVQVSFDVPEYTADVVATGVLRILEAVRLCGLEKSCRIYQASTSELYGKVEEVPQSETTPFHPYSPYAVAKQYGYWIIKEYREAYAEYLQLLRESDLYQPDKKDFDPATDFNKKRVVNGEKRIVWGEISNDNERQRIKKGIREGKSIDEILNDVNDSLPKSTLSKSEQPIELNDNDGIIYGNEGVNTGNNGSGNYNENVNFPNPNYQEGNNGRPNPPRGPYDNNGRGPHGGPRGPFNAGGNGNNMSNLSWCM